MALPGSGAISASMIRTELAIPSQVPFSLSSASLVHYSDLNALSISSSNDTLNITDPNAVSEWRNYNHAFTRSLEPFSNLRVPFGYPYATFAQVNIGTTSAVIPFTASNFASSGLAPRNEVTYSIFYSTYSLDMVGKSEFIQRGVLTAAAPSSSFTFNYTANSGSVVTFLFRNVQASWINCTSFSTSRTGLAGVGSLDSALIFGGTNTDTNITRACTEEWNGSSWSGGGNLINTLACLGGAGTQNAALAFGGQNNPTIGSSTVVACTEEYNGATWTAGGALIFCRQELAGVGTQNAALAIGGWESPNVLAFAQPEEYNGSTWATGNPMSFGRVSLAGAGTQNAAIAIGGCKTTPVNNTFSCTEKYDGTTWSTATGYAPRKALGASGTQNSTLIFGGAAYIFVSPTECVEVCQYDTTAYYNGITWNVENVMPSARAGLAGAGGAAIKGGAALAFGGHTVPNINTPGSRNYFNTVCRYSFCSI